MPAVYLRPGATRTQDVILRDTTTGPVLASGTCVASSFTARKFTDLVLYVGRAAPRDVTLRALILYGSPRLRLRPSGSSVAISATSGAATVIPGSPPVPPPPFVVARTLQLADGPASGTGRAQKERIHAAPRPFPLSKKKHGLGFEPKRTGFKAKRRRPPFRPMS